jgi:raffinose/stachyose/melibiose transport system substrate-binding protein
VKIPQNYKDLVDAVKTFRKNNVIPIAFNCMPEGSYLFQNIAMSLGGKAVENPIKNGVVDKSYINAMYIMRNLYKMGAFPDNDECFFIDSNTRDDLFINKKAAMIVQGTWFIANCNSANVDFIPFPSMSASSSGSLVYGLGCGTFYISQNAWDNPAKKAEAIKLLKCITSSNSSVQLADKTGMISNVNIDGSNIPYNTLTQKGINMINSAKTLIGPPDSYITRSVWENIIVKDFPDMLSGAVSPEVLWQRAIAAGAEEK